MRELANADRIQQFTRVMVDRGLVEVDRLRSAFDEIEPQLYRFPAIDPADYRRRVEDFLG
jgi:hypothetical protein